MFREETLRKTERRTYEDPDGEFLELVETNSNTITVLTRVDDEVRLGADVPDPSNHSVSDLEAELEEKIRTEGLTDAEKEAVLEAERAGKNRTTAISAIESVDE